MQLGSRLLLEGSRGCRQATAAQPGTYAVASLADVQRAASPGLGTPDRGLVLGHQLLAPLLQRHLPLGYHPAHKLCGQRQSMLAWTSFSAFR